MKKNERKKLNIGKAVPALFLGYQILKNPQ